MMMKKKSVWRIIISGIVLVGSILGFSFLNVGFKEPALNATNNSEFSTVKIPDSLTFAGETIPLHLFDVNESLDRELLVNSYFHSQTIRLIKLAPRYFSIIEPILKANGVPDDFKYLAVAESGLNPKSVSPAKAVGMWQFLKGTATDYGLEVNKEVDERYHIEKSTVAACDFLKESYEKFGSWTLAAATYNSGRNFIQKQTIRQKSTIYFDLLLGEETERYLFRILALKCVMENPEDYNFKITKDEKYPIIPVKEIEFSGKIENFADFALQNGTNYKLLKQFNPWLRDSFISNKNGKKYIVKVPIEGARKN